MDVAWFILSFFESSHPSGGLLSLEFDCRDSLAILLFHLSHSFNLFLIFSGQLDGFCERWAWILIDFFLFLGSWYLREDLSCRLRLVYHQFCQLIYLVLDHLYFLSHDLAFFRILPTQDICSIPLEVFLDPLYVFTVWVHSNISWPNHVYPLHILLWLRVGVDIGLVRLFDYNISTFSQILNFMF